MSALSHNSSPTDFQRRSFIYRELIAQGARFGEIADAAVALDFGAAKAEMQYGRVLGLADLSPMPRAGFKGAGTAEWLGQQGLAVPAQSSRAGRQNHGALVVRLAPAEVLILADSAGHGSEVANLNKAWHEAGLPPQAPRGFPLPRRDSHCWFRVTGEHAARMFAKLCAVDLRPHRFADLAVAQTFVARLGAIVIRDDLGSVPAYHLLADSAAAIYLWRCLLDAMKELDGRPVGLSAILALLELPQ